MSLSGAMSTAVSGINAQSKALGNISDNVANTQTSGYKRIDTAFSSLITQATPQSHAPGGVLSRPVYVNNVQGTIQSSSISTNLAIAGEGMFAVSQKTGVATAGGTPTFAADPLFTRAGDFSLDQYGYLVNGAGYVLNGWTVDPNTGRVASSSPTQPIQITQLKDNPQPTSAISLTANLPTQPDPTLDVNTATAAVIDMPSQAVTIYDPQGTPHEIQFNWSWSNATPSTWTLDLVPNSADIASINPPAAATTLEFHTTNDPVTGAQAGSIRSVNGGAVGAVGADVDISFSVNYAPKPPAVVGDTQVVTLKLGKYGVSQQLTNFTGTDIDLISATQDGLPPGSFRNLSITDDGMVTLNFDNGNQKTVYQVPIAQFSNYDGLQPEAGNAFSASATSGTRAYLAPGKNGTGAIRSSSVEGSNVDVSAELVKMIQAQSAYSANARVISTANEMLRTIQQAAQ